MRWRTANNRRRHKPLRPRYLGMFEGSYAFIHPKLHRALMRLDSDQP